MVTSLGMINIIDIRTGNSTLTCQQAASFGRITACYVDIEYTWLVTGTSTGGLCLWDLRYGLLIKQWRIGDTPIAKIAGHATKGAGRWILVSVETSAAASDVECLIAVDVGSGQVVERFRIATSTRQEGNLVMPAVVEETEQPQDVIAALLNARITPEKRRPATADTEVVGSRHITAIHSLSTSLAPTAQSIGLSPVQEAGFQGQQSREEESSGGGGVIITAGEDKIVRLWNLGRASESMVISAAGKDVNKRYR